MRNLPATYVALVFICLALLNYSATVPSEKKYNDISKHLQSLQLIDDDAINDTEITGIGSNITSSEVFTPIQLIFFRFFLFLIQTLFNSSFCPFEFLGCSSNEPEDIPESLPWKQIGKSIYGSTHRDRLGKTVAISPSGEWLAVGGIKTLLIYREHGGQWLLSHNFSNFVTQQPFSISFSSGKGDPFLIVGDGDFDDWEVFLSYVNVFKYQSINSTWEKSGQTLSGLSQKDGFGYSVDISLNGTHIAVGAPFGKYAQIFYWNESLKWNLTKQIDGEYGFGSTISLCGDAERVAIGNPLVNGNTGSISIYSSQIDFGFVHEIEGDEEDDWFGNSLSVSIDGSILVSGTSHQPWQRQQPYIKIFQVDSVSNIYTQIGENLMGEGSFGHSISISENGGILIIGGWSEGEGEGISLFELNTQDWLILGYVDERESSFTYGHSVDISRRGDRVAIGSPPEVGSTNERGRVDVYGILGKQHYS